MRRSIVPHQEQTGADNNGKSSDPHTKYGVILLGGERTSSLRGFGADFERVH